ncbi:unnamed protein product [Cylicocyclus nassatus]|uniref:Uncharacterized protein n=1 Tax=Cylicocyclus nassatus TaxID=53992 RepID=A0AA36M4J0_CYLNA|nr:unnamed protein product [Cylicocyclus nassatus]
MMLSEMNLTAYVFVATILVSSLSYVDGRSKKSRKEDELNRRPWLHDYTEDFLGISLDDYMLIDSARLIEGPKGGYPRIGRVLGMNPKLTKKVNAITYAEFRLSKEAFNFIQKITYGLEKERLKGISQVNKVSRDVSRMTSKSGLCRELSQYLEGSNYKRGIKSILESDRSDHMRYC